jgi:hypothetical protein
VWGHVSREACSTRDCWCRWPFLVFDLMLRRAGIRKNIKDNHRETVRKRDVRVYRIHEIMTMISGPLELGCQKHFLHLYFLICWILTYIVFFVCFRDKDSHGTLQENEA